MTEDALPESDRVPGAPHPREAAEVIGQDGAVRDFLAAAQAQRLHHGWLLTGPRGSGKATLAWAIAKWLIAGGAPDRLAVPPETSATVSYTHLTLPTSDLV